MKNLFDTQSVFLQELVSLSFHLCSLLQVLWSDAALKFLKQLLLLSRQVTEWLNLNFYNCVLLTDVSDATYFHDCISESKDSETYKQKNFKTFDTHAYIYDLRLDSASVARGKASTTYAALYPIDRYGVERGEKPDAGCYQYQEK